MAASSPITEIESLFDQWLDIACGDPVYEGDWLQSPYVTIQRAIVAAEPATPRDLAIQFYVSTDQFGSDYGESFQALIMRLVCVEVPA